MSPTGCGHITLRWSVSVPEPRTSKFSKIGQSAPSSDPFGQSRPRITRSWPCFVQLLPRFGRFRPIKAEDCPKLAGVQPRSRPKSTNFEIGRNRPKWARTQHWPGIVQNCSGFDQTWPARIDRTCPTSADFDTSSAKIGRNSTKLGPNLANSGPKLTKFDQTWPGNDQIWPELPNLDHLIRRNADYLGTLIEQRSVF